MPPNQSNQPDYFEDLEKIDAHLLEDLVAKDHILTGLIARLDEIIKKMEELNKKKKCIVEKKNFLIDELELKLKFFKNANEEEIRKNEIKLNEVRLMNRKEVELIEKQLGLISKEYELLSGEDLLLDKQKRFVCQQNDLVNQILQNEQLAYLVALKLITKEKIIQNLNQFSNKLKEVIDDKERIFEDA